MQLSGRGMDKSWLIGESSALKGSKSNVFLDLRLQRNHSYASYTWTCFWSVSIYQSSLGEELFVNEFHLEGVTYLYIEMKPLLTAVKTHIRGDPSNVLSSQLNLTDKTNGLMQLLLLENENSGANTEEDVLYVMGKVWTLQHANWDTMNSPLQSKHFAILLCRTTPDTHTNWGSRNIVDRGRKTVRAGG